jgi:O-antigen ligase
MQRSIVHVGIFGLALIAAGSGRYSRHLVWAVLVGICVVAGAGLVSRLYPDLIRENVDLGGGPPYRLSYPWTYWNAAGAFAAMGAVLAFGLAADPRTRVPLRALAAGVTVPLFVAMYLSFSRGAWLALIVAVVVLVALGAHRGSLLLTAVVVGIAATLAVLRLRSYPALTIDPAAGAGQESAGHAYAPQLLLLAGGAIVAQAIIAAGRASDAVMDPLRRAARPVGTVAAVLLALFAVVAYGLRAGSLEGWTADRLNATSSWISDQWDDFLTPAQFGAAGAARLTSARGTRSDVYRVAFDAFEGNPLIGEGAGSFEQRWIRDRRVVESMRNAHSLELETLGELGLVGGLLLLTVLGSAVAAAVRSRRRPGGLTRSEVAAVGAAFSVWIAHSAVDWDWQMTALTGTALVLAAPLYPYGRRRRRMRSVGSAAGGH